MIKTLVAFYYFPTTPWIIATLYVAAHVTRSSLGASRGGPYRERMFGSLCPIYEYWSGRHSPALVPRTSYCSFQSVSQYLTKIVRVYHGMCTRRCTGWNHCILFLLGCQTTKTTKFFLCSSIFVIENFSSKLEDSMIYLRLGSIPCGSSKISIFILIAIISDYAILLLSDHIRASKNK